MIGIVGGTGDFGQGLAERLRRLGEEVELGSRTPRDEFVSNRDCAQDSDIVFLSVPPEGLAEMCASLAANLEGKVVVSVASPVVFKDGKPGAEPGERSLAELAAQAAPGARMVAGFHTVSAKALDAGRLEVARWLEPLTAVLLNVNRRYKVSSGVKVTGLP